MRPLRFTVSFETKIEFIGTNQVHYYYTFGSFAWALNSQPFIRSSLDNSTFFRYIRKQLNFILGFLMLHHFCLLMLSLPLLSLVLCVTWNIFLRPARRQKKKARRRSECKVRTIQESEPSSIKKKIINLSINQKKDVCFQDFSSPWAHALLWYIWVRAREIPREIEREDICEILQIKVPTWEQAGNAAKKREECRISISSTGNDDNCDTAKMIRRLRNGMK